jgi:hypothetical protein
MEAPHERRPDDADAFGRTSADIARITPLDSTDHTPRHEDAVVVAGYRAWVHVRDVGLQPDMLMPGVRMPPGKTVPRGGPPAFEVRFTLDFHNPNSAGRPLRAVDDPATRAAAALFRIAPCVALEVWAAVPGADLWTYAVMPLLVPHPARRTHVVGKTGAELYWRVQTGSPWGRGRWPVADDGAGNPALLPLSITATTPYLMLVTSTRPPAVELSHPDHV